MPSNRDYVQIDIDVATQLIKWLDTFVDWCNCSHRHLSSSLASCGNYEYSLTQMSNDALRFTRCIGKDLKYIDEAKQ